MFSSGVGISTQASWLQLHPASSVKPTGSNLRPSESVTLDTKNAIALKSRLFLQGVSKRQGDA